jgi:hypothetical protein
MDSTFATMQQWAESAKEYPAWWTQSQGDYLLFRRTKMRLRSDYERSQSEKDKQQTAGVQQTFFATNSYQYGTNALSNLAGVTDSSQGLSLGTCTDGYLSISNSALYPFSEAINGKSWNAGVGDKSLAVQGRAHLEMPAVPYFNLEAPNTAHKTGIFPYFDHPPDNLSQTVYDPPQPVLAFQEHWDEGEHTSQLVRLQPEVQPQTLIVNPTEFDFNDPF